MRLFLRSAAFNLVMFGACLVLTLKVYLTMRLTEQARILRTGQLWARITLRALARICRIRIAVEGREHLPGDAPALIAAQHQSAFDTLFWLTVLPRPAYVLKRELVKIPLFGPLLTASGFVAVDREGGGAALRRMVAQCRAAMEQGRQIVIFPEGTRVPAGERGTVQPGVLALARALNLPVIPASTDSGLYWGRKAFKKRPGTITVRLHAPIDDPQRGMLTELERRYYGEAVDNSVCDCAENLGAKI